MMAHEDEDGPPIEMPIVSSRMKNPSRFKEEKTNVITTSNNSSEQVHSTTPRDPRFDQNCSGSDDRRHFVRNYSFLNEVKQNELKELQRALKFEKNPERKNKLKATISRYRNKMLISDGDLNTKKNRGKFKKLELAEKFKDLKETGKLTKYLERKRKKLLKRDQKSFGPKS